MTNALIATLVLLATSTSAAPAKAKLEPKITFSVPAACSDVYKQVYVDLDSTWSVTILEPSSVDERVPGPEELGMFIASVPQLEAVLVKAGAPEKDIFYIRAHTRSLSYLQKKYPSIDPGILEAAKLQACRDRAS